MASDGNAPLPPLARNNRTFTEFATIALRHCSTPSQTLPQMRLPSERRFWQACLRRSAMLCSAFFK